MSRTRLSRVTIVTSCGGSSSNSAVAKCTASSVRMGSTGNGLPTRARTTLLTSTRNERRSNVRNPRTAACSWATVNRPTTRARTIARAASARVRADVTYRPSALSASNAAVSCSRSAARRALDSMYRIPATAAWTVAREVGRRLGRGRRTLRFATVAVDQVRGRATRESDIRPVLQGVASLDGRTNNAGSNELVEPTSLRSPRARRRRNQFGDDTPMCRYRNPLACLDSADVPAQVVLQLPDSCLHDPNIATCGHICKFENASLELDGYALFLLSPANEGPRRRSNCRTDQCDIGRRLTDSPSNAARYDESPRKRPHQIFEAANCRASWGRGAEPGPTFVL